jgi:recombinational DNA repair protein RecR
MDIETTQALWESIEHWLWNYNNPMWAETSAKSCPLCNKFQEQSKCYECPIYKETGQHLCYGTPYYDVRDNIMDRYKLNFGTYQELVINGHNHKLSNIYYDSLRESIRAEYEFLVNLIDTPYERSDF